MNSIYTYVRSLFTKKKDYEKKLVGSCAYRKMADVKQLGLLMPVKDTFGGIDYPEHK